jgi:hypothetical protein
MKTLGELLINMEDLLDSMIDQHGLQCGDILAIVKCHIDIHRPDCIEEYEDGGRPEMYYGSDLPIQFKKGRR